MDDTVRCPSCEANLTLPSVAAQAPAQCPRCKALIAPQHAIAAAPIIGVSASQAFQAGMPAVVAPPGLEDEFDLRIVRPPQDWNVAWSVCGVCALIAFVDAMVLLLEADKAHAIDGVLQGGLLVFWWPELQSAVNILSLLSVLTWIAAPFVVLYWIFSAHGSQSAVDLH